MSLNLRNALSNVFVGTSGGGGSSVAAITSGTITGLTDFGVAMANNTAMTGFALGTISDTTSRPFAITQTWNNASLSATGLSLTITDTSSASTSKPLEVLGGTLGTTSLFALSKAGKITLPNPASYLTPGFSFGTSNSGIGNSAGSINFIISGNESAAAMFGNMGDGVNRGYLAAKTLNLTGLGSDPSGSGRMGVITSPGVANVIHLGMSSASPFSQLLAAGGSLVGTTSNGSPGTTFTIAGPVSTGTGTGGDIILGVYGTNGASGTAIGTLNTVITINAARKVLNVTGIPTSSAGLSSGDVYSNAGVLTVV